jgi:hypothetical protein
MRKLFWILLLTNVILFAGMRQNWFVQNESALVQGPPLNAKMIRLQAVTPTAPTKAPIPANPAPTHASIPQTPAPAPAASPPTIAAASPAQPMTTVAPSANKDSNAPVCVEWGDFSGTDLTRATAALASLQLGDKVSHHQMERDIGYWVYIPPMKNKTAVNQKITELKALGIREYFIVQNEGRWRNAISMGVFKSREAAQNYLQYLHTKGVHSAKVGERASKLITTVFRLDNIDAVTRGKVAEIQNDFPGGELKNVPCAQVPGVH